MTQETKLRFYLGLEPILKRVLESGGAEDDLLRYLQDATGLRVEVVPATEKGQTGLEIPLQLPGHPPFAYLRITPPDEAMEYLDVLYVVSGLLSFLLAFREKETEMRGLLTQAEEFLLGELQGEGLRTLLSLLQRMTEVHSLGLFEVLEDEPFRCHPLLWVGEVPPTEDLVEDLCLRKALWHKAQPLPSTLPLLRLGGLPEGYLFPFRNQEGILLGGLVVLGRRPLTDQARTLLHTWEGLLRLALDRRRWVRLLRSLSNDAVLSMVAIEEMRDPYTRGHSERVARNAVRIGQALGLSSEHLEKLRFAALLHDIGKVGIPDMLLLKPTRLEKDEREILEAHVELGYHVLHVMDSFRDIARWIRFHHERWDGSGYPLGLRGREIPLESQIIGICDTYDAMITERPYKRPLSHEEAIRRLEALAGTQFDPELVRVAIQVLSDQPRMTYTTPAFFQYVDRIRKQGALQVAQAAILQQATLRFWAGESLEEILNDVLRVTVESLQLDSAVLRLIREDRVVVTASHGLPPEYLEAHRSVPSAPLMHLIPDLLREGMFFPDVQTSEIFQQHFPGMLEMGIRSVFVVPLRATTREEQIHGYVAFHARKRRDFSPEQRHLLLRLGDQLALLIEHRDRERRERSLLELFFQLLETLHPLQYADLPPVSRVVGDMAEALGLSPERRFELQAASYLLTLHHLLVPDLLVIKQQYGSPLTPTEQAVLEDARTLSRTIIDRLPGLDPWRHWVLQALEGVPRSLEAQILHAVHQYYEGASLATARSLSPEVRAVAETIFQRERDRPPQPAASASPFARSYQEMLVLYEIGAQLEHVEDAESFAATVLEILARITRHESFFLLASTREGMKVLAAWGFPREVLGQEVPLGQGIVGEAARTKRPVLLNNTTEDPRYIPPAGRPMGSALAVPLVHRDRLIGVLAVENTRPETFTERDMEFFSMLSRYLAPIVLLLMEPRRHP